MKSIIFIFALWSLTAFAAQGDLLNVTELTPITADQIKADRTYCPASFPYPEMPSKIGSAEIRVYALTYETLNSHGQVAVASGALMVPNIKKIFSLMSYQHGTVFGHEQVPSRKHREGRVQGACYGSQEYAVVASDYVGYGDSKEVHAYLDAQTAAINSADMIRAAKAAAKQLNIQLNSKLFLAGYSQGGAVTMALHHLIQKDLPTEMTVTASAPMAGPYDLEYTNTSFLKEARSVYSHSFVAYFIWTQQKLNNLFPSLKDVFQEPYANQLDQIFDGTKGFKEVFEAFPRTKEELFVTGFADAVVSNPDHPMRKALRKHKVYDWKPETPMLLLHGSIDPEVPNENMIKACQKMKSYGGDVTCTMLDIDHMYGLQTMVWHAIKFFDKYQ